MRCRYPLIRLSYALFGVALVGVTLVEHGCARSDHVRAGTTAPRPSATAAAAALDRRVRGWELRKLSEYSLKVSTTVAFGSGGDDFDFDVSGGLEVVPVELSSERALLYLSLPDARVVSRIAVSQAELDRLAAELRSSGALFELTGGLLGDLRVPEGMSQMTASTYRQIATALQFAHASDDSKRYTAEETDTTGKYVAEYTLDPDGNSWHKRKLRYVGLLGAESLPADAALRLVPQVLESRGTVQLAADGRPTKVDLLDRMEVNGAQAPVRSTLRIQLEASGAGRLAAPPDLAALLARTKRIASDQPIRDESAVRTLEDAKIGGLAFDTIVQRLEAQANTAKARQQAREAPADDDESASPDRRAKAEQDLREEARLFNALTAWYVKDPRTTLKAVQRIREKSPAADTLLDALGSAATPAAHAALAKLLGRTETSRSLQGRIILSLARSPKPTKEATLALKAVLEHDPLNAGALYGLGTYSRLLRDQGALADARELGEFLIARLSLATAPMSLGTVLRAIANSGYAGALPYVERYLDDPNERARAVAVRALQSMHDARVDALIATRILDDSTKVRLAALEAAKLREPSVELAQALARVSTQPDTDPHVRYRAVELMVDWLPKRTDLRDTLELIAKNDGEPRVRQIAQAAL
jgi:hypothetical protein